MDEIIACPKRVYRLVEKWQKYGGRRGYFDFVKQFFLYMNLETRFLQETGFPGLHLSRIVNHRPGRSSDRPGRVI